MSYTVKTTRQVDQSQVDDCLEGAHIGYWGLFTNEARTHVAIREDEHRKGEKKVWKLNIQKGLDLMGKNYPMDLSNLVMDNADAATGDVLVQLAAFGKLVYG